MSEPRIPQQPGVGVPPAPAAPAAPGATVPPGGVGGTGPQPAGAPSVPPTDRATSGTAADRETPAGFDEHGRLQRTLSSGAWIALVVSALIVVALIVFMVQNTARFAVHFLGFSGHISVGLGLLIAAVGGVLLAAIPGTLRILQLRRALKRNAGLPGRGARRGHTSHPGR